MINALRGAFGDPIHHRSHKAILDLLEFLTPENAERVRNLFFEYDKKGVGLDFAWSAFWTRWGEIDPLGALNFALSQKDLLERAGHPHLQNIMRGWSAVDPVAAQRWLREHPQVPHYKWLVSALAANWAVTNASDATAFVLSLPLDENILQNSLGEIAETLRKVSGPERVEAWFAGLDDRAKPLAFNHAASRIKDGNIEKTKSWFASQADKPWRDDRYYLDFVQRYGAQDPAAGSGARQDPGQASARRRR